MLNILLIELLCIPFLVYIFFQDLKNKTEATTICAGFIIGLSIINWFAYAFLCTGFIIQTSQGFFEGDLNIIGLILAITPSILIIIISYIIFKIILKIKRGG